MTFLNAKYHSLVPYTPGEQPKNQKLIKLNTNENPYPPAPAVIEAATQAAKTLNRYSDPTNDAVIQPLAQRFGVKPTEVFLGNGSDEVLALIFQGFTEAGVAFADITYGFYQVYSDFYQVPTQIVPLQDDLNYNLAAYPQTGTIVIANPNAPTGLYIPPVQMQDFLIQHREQLVVVDEAYIDFGGESLVNYIEQYPNLLVVGTFSKSRQLAGARLGYAVGNEELINELNRLKFSFNPYNVNSMTLACGAACLATEDYVTDCLAKIVASREWAGNQLQALGFDVTDSYGNFLFIQHDQISGEKLFQALREQQILVRWFPQARIENYLRITIGTQTQMELFVAAIQQILGVKK